MLTVALFGEGSFFANRHGDQNQYVYPNAQIGPEYFGPDPCMELFPLTRLRTVWVAGCSGAYARPSDDAFAFASSLLPHLDEFLNTTLFLAHRAWLPLPGMDPPDARRTVWLDAGVPTFTPTVSPTGIVVASVLLALHLAGLLALAVYTARARSWTRDLDAFAMLRIGAAYTEHLPLMLEGRSYEAMKTLDALPGNIGDERPDGESGRLAMGVPGPLGGGERKYASYGFDST
jgi:hypothetical protein